MELTIIAFGIARDIFNAPSIQVTIEGIATTANLKTQLELQYPRLAALRSYMVAVNNEYAQPGLQLKPGDEIAIIPPVSGG